MSEKLFLCYYCGIFIKKNIANLKRHEKLHKVSSIKIECAIESCKITFQNKSNYTRHWREKHPSMKLPDGLKFVEKESKSRKTIKNKCVNRKFAAELINGTPPAGLQFKRILDECQLREPFFGKLQWN